MNINYELIGLRIRQIRKERNLSQEELAELSDVSARFISMIETGRKNPSLKVLCEIAGGLEISLDEIVFGEAKPIRSRTNGWETLLSDCTNSEKDIIIETAVALKQALAKKRPSLW